MSARLQEKYKKDVVPVLTKEFGIGNTMAIPRIEKVVLNMGVGEAISNAKIVDAAADELTKIAGQKAVVTRAKKSIATFQLRAGMPIGCRVTLRGDRMYEFLDRLLNVAPSRARLPWCLGEGFRRTRQLHWASGPSDLPRDRPTKIEKSRGLNVTIVTTAGSDDRARVGCASSGCRSGADRGRT
jgi:large subunit ribosomal protein L5